MSLDQSFQYVRSLISASKNEQELSQEIIQYYKFIDEIFALVFLKKTSSSCLNYERYQKLIFILRSALESPYYRDKLKENLKIYNFYFSSCHCCSLANPSLVHLPLL